MSLKNKSQSGSSDGAPLGGGISLGAGQPRFSNQGGGARPKPRFSSPAGSPAPSSPAAGSSPYPSSLNLGGSNGPSSRPSSRLSGTQSPAPPAAAPTPPPPNAWAQKPSFASAARTNSAASIVAPAPSAAAPVTVNGDTATGATEKEGSTSTTGAATPPLPYPSASPAPAPSDTTPAHIASAQGLLNSHVTIVTTKETYDGILTDLARPINQKGASLPHVILQKACIKGMKRDVMIREWQGPHEEVVSIAKWTLDPAEAGPAPSNAKSRKSEGFKTDTDISRAAQLGQERVLVAWDAGSPPSSPAVQGGLDADTFGPSAGSNGKKGAWDQFAENERRFGTKTDFDEEMYTTKLVRNGDGWKDRERKAEAMAREIMGAASSNPHIQEERGQAVNSALGEEDRYAGVVRAANAYVPPAARKAGGPAPPPQTTAPAAAAPPAPPPAAGQRSNSPIMDPAVVRSSSSAGPNPAKLGPAAPPLLKVASSGANDGSVESPSADKSVLAAFQDFVKSDRQRLEQKKKLIDSKVKSEKDKKLKELMKFGQDFKLKTAIPQDLVPILAKDAEKQKAIIEKAAADALAAKSAPPPAPTPSPKVRLAQPGAPFSTPQAPSAKGRSSMIISDIPPFNPNKKLNALPAGSPAPPSPATSMASSSGAASGARMNVAAQPFVFKPTIPAFKPAAGKSPVPIVREIPPFNGTPKSTPKVAAAQLANSPSVPKATTTASSAVPPPSKSPASASAPLNPFFGNKVPKRSAVPDNVRDDFNPHKMSKLAMAPSYPPNWPYGARSYKAAFPPMFAADLSQDFPYGGGEPSHPHQQQPGLGPGGAAGPGMQPHMVSPSMMHAQPQGMYGGQAYPGGYYQPYRFAQPGMPQGMPPNASNAGPSSAHHGGALNASGGPGGAPAGAGGFAQQPGGGFVPMFQPGQPGGPPGGPQPGMGPYGVQVMMMPQGGMYTPIPGYQGQPGQQMGGGPPFVNGQAGGGRGAPMGYYPMQQGQMQSPQQMGHVYQPQFMGGQPPPHFTVGIQGGQPGGGGDGPH